jgi:hypothetical protein
MTDHTFDTLVAEAFAHIWALDPTAAVYVGKHEYDGIVPDWSPGTVATHLDALQAIADRMALLDDLTEDDELDREILTSEIASIRFDWHELRTYARSPMQWVYQLDPDLYMKRSYAPVAERARVATRLLSQAGDHLEQARERLDPVVPRTFAEWGAEAASGLADMIRNDTAAAFALEEGVELDALRDACTNAADDLDGFAAWINDTLVPFADDSFPIGRARMERLLQVGEMVTMSVETMLEVAEQDLADNLEAFVEVAEELDDSLGPRDVYQKYVASVHVGPDELIPTTEAMLEDIRTFLIERDIITVPSEVRAQVAETPPHLRWAFAMMDTPGPYETEATEAYYYVTPVDPSWSEEEAEQWLEALNTFALEAISIHEAYPGHYVHFLHYDNAPTEVSKRLASYAFTEGWAHYAEQMMWEQGYREGDPRFRLAQLAEALVRNCRFVCALRLHVYGMTVDEATEFFVENAFYEELPARKEAERGTFDPGYFSYTLGKLQILALRDDVRDREGRGFTLKGFHDALLSRGAPSVTIMRRVLL